MSSPATKSGILVGVDGSAQSDAAIRFATRESVMRDVPVTLMHVIEPLPDWATRAEQDRIAQVWQDNARDVIESARKTAVACVTTSASLDLHTEIACSPVAAMFVLASAQAHMVVVGSRGMTPPGRFLLGSVSNSLVHHAQCPVAVIHYDPEDETGSVLVGVDGSPASDGAIAFAFEEASRRGVDLLALHAWSDVAVFPILGMDWRDYETRGAEILAERLAGYQQEYPGVQVRRRLVCDKPAHWLIEESRHAQLVVVGSRGRGGFPHMRLGSVSSALTQSSKAPLVVVR
ncbi:universal stress protein [Mycobacterium sp.]|uniref:universal stress protein n=1 Tax=Mycobacterium sp. TaxID=1785 RepID=UPI003BAF8732